MKNIVLLLAISFILSCTDDDATGINETDPLELTLVTGIDLRETPDQVPMRLGNPNIFNPNQMNVYPNPSLDVLTISAGQPITDLYFIASQAEKIHQDVIFEDLLNSNTYDESTISSSAVLKVTNENSNAIAVNISGLAPGYYKVFIKLGGDLYWDTIYKLDTTSGTNKEFDALINFWD